MFIEQIMTDDRVTEECVVVIDVLRAFTTAAFAFSAGAARIIAVETIEEAFAFKNQDADFLLVGERNRRKIDGFDFTNSPHEIQKTDLNMRTLVQRTSCGTRGIIQAKQSKHVLPASFVVAEATYRRILEINPEKVTFLITGNDQSDEDLAFAEYLSLKLENRSPVDPAPFLQRVIDSPLGRQFRRIPQSSYPMDLQLAVHLDRFSFAMQVKDESGNATIYPIQVNNEIFIRRT